MGKKRKKEQRSNVQKPNINLIKLFLGAGTVFFFLFILPYLLAPRTSSGYSLPLSARSRFPASKKNKKSPSEKTSPGNLKRKNFVSSLFRTPQEEELIKRYCKSTSLINKIPPIKYCEDNVPDKKTQAKIKCLISEALTKAIKPHTLLKQLYSHYSAAEEGSLLSIHVLELTLKNQADKQLTITFDHEGHPSSYNLNIFLPDFSSIPDTPGVCLSQSVQRQIKVALHNFYKYRFRAERGFLNTVPDEMQLLPILKQGLDKSIRWVEDHKKRWVQLGTEEQAQINKLLIDYIPKAKLTIEEPNNYKINSNLQSLNQIQRRSNGYILKKEFFLVFSSKTRCTFHNTQPFNKLPPQEKINLLYLELSELQELLEHENANINNISNHVTALLPFEIVKQFFSKAGEGSENNSAKKTNSETSFSPRQ